MGSLSKVTCFKTGNILEEDCEAIVNTVNCVGVMGRGIALQFKQAYPDNFRAYVAACKRGEVQPGKMFVFETALLTGPRYIINFPTKRHWSGKSRMEDIESGLTALVQTIQNKGIHSIAIPPLGCGLGGLDWQHVRPRIVEAMQLLQHVTVVVYEPDSSIARHKGNVTAHSNPPKMTPGRAALVELIRLYLKGLLDPWITLLEIHKLMYFMQEAGEPLRLKYVEHHYGPYAENLRHVLSRIEGHFLEGFQDDGDDPTQQITLIPGSAEKAREFLKHHPQTQEHFERVAELVDGYESPLGLELLTTVHWVMKYKGCAAIQDVVDAVHRWNPRKAQFTVRQIEGAMAVLVKNNWIRL